MIDAADRDEEERSSRLALVDEVGELEPAGHDRAQAGEDRRQTEPVERDPDELAVREPRRRHGRPPSVRSSGTLRGRSGRSWARRPRRVVRRVTPRRRILRRRCRVPVTVERDGRAGAARGGARSRPARRTGRATGRASRCPVDTTPIRPSRNEKTGFSPLPGVVVGAAVRRPGPRGWPGRRTGRGGAARRCRDRLVRAPRVLEPARADLGVGPAVDAALRAIRRAERPVVAQVAVVAEREPAGRVVERLGVGQGQRRQPRRPPQVDERGRRLDRPDRLAPGSSRKARMSRYDPSRPSRAEPGRAPAEARRARTARGAR